MILKALPQTSLNDDDYQNEILKHVSRTFALTIPQLPDPLRRVIVNAYLLCRIADTIEDDTSMSAARKRIFSSRFIAVVNGSEDAKTFTEQLYPELSASTTASERDLIVNTEVVIRVTHRFNQRQRKALERCVAVMADGMARYQDAETLAGVSDLDDMGKYCYYVAGVVGEMLTELFCDYSLELDQRRSELMALSVSFGQGLQMTNILKDIWEDHVRGACWLPRDIFDKYGVNITHKVPGGHEPGFDLALFELLGVAHAHIANAMKYTLIIPVRETGLRRFCLWALGMAILTLEKIRRNPHFTSGQQVKISRSHVKLTMFLTSLFVRQDWILKHLFRLSGRRLPMANI